MFTRILVPLDLTDRHGRALAIAAELARQARGEVVLVHVIEIIPGVSMEEEREFYARLEETARVHLQRHARMLAGDKVRCRMEIFYGRRAQEISRFAAEVDAGLIVLTAPRIDQDNPEGLGSLSYKVALLAGCPVLLVK